MIGNINNFLHEAYVYVDKKQKEFSAYVNSTALNRNIMKLGQSVKSMAQSPKATLAKVVSSAKQVFANIAQAAKTKVSNWFNSAKTRVSNVLGNTSIGRKFRYLISDFHNNPLFRGSNRAEV